MAQVSVPSGTVHKPGQACQNPPPRGGHIAVNKFAGHRSSMFVATNPSVTVSSLRYQTDVEMNVCAQRPELLIVPTRTLDSNFYQNILRTLLPNNLSEM